MEYSGSDRIAMTEPRPKSLLANFTWTFLGNVVYAICQWAMLVVIAKFGNPAMVGEFSLGLAVTAPIMMGARLGLRGIQATDADGEYGFSEYLALRGMMMGLALCAVLVIVSFSGYTQEAGSTVVWIGIAKAVESLGDVVQGLMQRNEQMGFVGRSLILKGVLSLLALGTAVYSTRNITCGSAALALSWFAVLFWYDLRYCHRVAPHFSLSSLRTVRWSALKALVALAWPLGISGALISLNTNIPRYYVESSLGKSSLGVFSAMAYVVVAGNTVVSALAQSASPRLAKHHRARRSKAFAVLMVRLLSIGLGLGAAGVLAAAWAGPVVLTVLYTPEYAAQNDAFVWLMVSAMLSYVTSFLNEGLTAVRYVHIQLPIVLASSAITLGASWRLVPRYGLLGAALAMVLAMTVRSIVSLSLVVHAIRHTNGPRER